MTFPNIDPVLFSIGPFHVRWYGLMYIMGFIATYLLVKRQIRHYRFTELESHFENLNFVLILSVILGGRLGYVLFYNLSYYLQHPLEIPATWTGGMSFHGACIALFIGGICYCKIKKLSFLKTADIYIVTFPIGLFLGRLGNFINGELYGRVTDVSWGMVFPYGGPYPRHPSQLYEAFLEGICLFLLLWLCKNRVWRTENPWPFGSLTAIFLIGYGCARSFVELFREPDSQLGFFFGYLTMGQLLSSCMIAGGTILLWLLFHKRK